jgi:RNA polymerase sigma factor (sigma-70 family)
MAGPGERGDYGADEARAIAALRRKDPAGLEELVRLHQVRALRLAYAVLEERAAAEDVVSDAFVRTFEKIHQYDVSRPFAPWFNRIVVNGARKALRRRRLEFRLHLPTNSTQLADDKSMAEHAVAIDEQRAVISAIRMLPDAERLVVALRYYLELNEREMSEMLGWPAGTVKRRLYNARAHLRDRLAGLLGQEDASEAMAGVELEGIR